MREPDDQKLLLNLLQGTAEAMGAELKPAALALMANDLEPYSLVAIQTALARCRHEVSGRLTLAVIMDRLQGVDSRPAPNEAWAIALKARDENETVVWCHEIASAWWAAAEILRAGDKVGARAAFIEVYTRMVAEARIFRRPAKWAVSLGRDPDLRRIAVESACIQGLLTEAQRLALAPPMEITDNGLFLEMTIPTGTKKTRCLLRELKGYLRHAKKQAGLACEVTAQAAKSRCHREEARRAELMRQAHGHSLGPAASTPPEALA